MNRVKDGDRIDRFDCFRMDAEPVSQKELDKMVDREDPGRDDARSRALSKQPSQKMAGPFSGKDNNRIRIISAAWPEILSDHPYQILPG
jgi:hypothetical protein